jgi:parallel beta-helix repeat protein
VLFNEITDIGMLQGAMFARAGAIDQMQAINIKGAGSNVIGNNLERIGYNGIQYRYSNNYIAYNFIQYYCQSFMDGQADGAGIYTVVGSTATTYTNNLVYRNIVKNQAGVANNYYADDFANGIVFRGNTSIGADNGIYLHNARYITLDSNIVYQPGTYGLFIYNNDVKCIVSNLVNTNNTYFSTSSGFFIKPVSVHRNDVATWFTSSNRNKYWRPNIAGNSFLRYDYKAGTSTKLTGSSFTLSAWRTMYGYDANSVEGPVSYNPPAIFYNTTQETADVDLHANYKFFDESVNDSITLQPYESRIGMLQSVIDPPVIDNLILIIRK